MGELDEADQRKLLETHGWIPVGEKIGEGGGARVFKVVSMRARGRLVDPLMTPWNDRNVAMERALSLSQTIAEIADGTEPVFAAGKVARNADHRIKREIEILRDVQHPNLIRSIASSESDPRWYVMPLMRGGTLKEARFRGNVRAVLQGMAQVADALAMLHHHHKPIVHRDLKPSNVFVGDGGEWILGDPGIAHRDDGGDATTTRPVSKDWYPRWYEEEYGDLPVADCYMLAATAVYLLTGGEKLKDPSWLSQPKFNLVDLFPHAAGVRECYVHPRERSEDD